MTHETTAVMALLVPLGGCLLIGAAGRWPNVRELITLATAGALFCLVASLYQPVVNGADIHAQLIQVLPGTAGVPRGISLEFHIEPLGLIYALLASFLWILNSLYSIGYMRTNQEANQTVYYMCFALALFSVIGIAFSGNLFTMFTFYELLSLCTFPLVTHKRTPEAVKAGRVYLGVLIGSSVGLQLAAIIWTYAMVGHGEFMPGGILAGVVGATPAVLGLLYVLYVYGIAKCALMPLHKWLPAAMVAPTPVSALLHAVAVVKAGVFCVLKVTVYTFGLNTLTLGGHSDWLVWMACFTIVVGSLIAMYQDNLKRRLAYSTISQLSYIVLAAGLATPIAIQGGALHMVMHGFGKITLFFCAGAIYTAAHKTEISTMKGIGRKMPWTMLAFTLGSLSIIGLPPFGGAWSKWLLFVGALDAGQQVVLVVLAVSSLLNIAYLMPIIINAWFLPKSEDSAGIDKVHEAPLLIVVPLMLTAIGGFVLFVWPDPLVKLAGMIAGAVGGPAS
ncbi:MAG: monovalent cation/H+ antiporter subunit D family protein [Planctomycetota bacterium]